MTDTLSYCYDIENGTIEGMRNIHVPLPEPAYTMLREEAKRTGRPATVLVREAVEDWLRDRRRAEVARYAAEYGGTEADLDPDLEAASIESLLGAEG